MLNETIKYNYYKVQIDYKDGTAGIFNELVQVLSKSTNEQLILKTSEGNYYLINLREVKQVYFEEYKFN